MEIIPNPFASLVDLIEDALGKHSTNLQPVLDAIAEVTKAQADSNAKQEQRWQVLQGVLQSIGGTLASEGDVVSALKVIQGGVQVCQTDLLSIKAFLGVPDARIGATQEELDALGKRLQDETNKAEQIDQTLQPPQMKEETT